MYGTYNDIDSKVRESTDSVNGNIVSFKYIVDNINEVTDKMKTILEITNYR